MKRQTIIIANNAVQFYSTLPKSWKNLENLTF